MLTKPLAKAEVWSVVVSCAQRLVNTLQETCKCFIKILSCMRHPFQPGLPEGWTKPYRNSVCPAQFAELFGWPHEDGSFDLVSSSQCDFGRSPQTEFQPWAFSQALEALSWERDSWELSVSIVFVCSVLLYASPGFADQWPTFGAKMVAGSSTDMQCFWI